MRLTTWTSTDCPTKGFGCAARSAAIAFRCIATARRPEAVEERLRGRRRLHGVNQPRLGLGRAHPRPDRRRRPRPSSSRSLRTCLHLPAKSISPRHSRAGILATCRHRRREGHDPSISILLRLRIWRTSPRPGQSQGLRVLIRSPTWTCRRPSSRPVAPTFLHR